MDTVSKNNHWIYSLNFKAWCIAYENRDPEEQKEQIIELVKSYCKDAE